MRATRRIVTALILFASVHTAYADAVSDALRAIRLRHFPQAVHLLYPAAKAGNKDAQYQLAILIRNGQGTKQNPRVAAQWLQLASKQGLAKAQYALGVMYLDGNGVAENKSRAKHWLQMAARQGHPAAKAKLARLRNVPDVDVSTLDEKLILAAQRKSSDDIGDLLNAGARINAKDELGNTALIIAARIGADAGIKGRSCKRRRGITAKPRKYRAKR